jgi:Flp pilus assembly secretin CpaC
VAAAVLALAGLAVLINSKLSDAPVPTPVGVLSPLTAPTPTPAPSPVAPLEPAVQVEEVNEPVVAESLPADGVELDLEPSQNRTFDVSGATQVVIADPRVADVAVDETELTLGGLALGKTTLSITLRGRTHVFPVRVRTAALMAPQHLTMLTGTERDLNLPGLTRITMGDASVLDVRTSGNGQLHFTAGLPGTTNVFVWTRDARRFEYVVEVTALPAPEGGPVPLVVGLQQVLDFPGVTHASVSDPTVCEVKRLGDHELLLLPQKPGTATLQVWMGAKGATRALFVRAGP